MANLFELMNDRPSHNEVKIRECSVTIRNTPAILDMLTPASHNKERLSTGYERQRPRETPASLQANTVRVRDDARTPCASKEHTVSRCEGMMWSDNQQLVTSFTIPKKNRGNKGLLVEIPVASREWHQEVLPILLKSYRHRSSQGAFSYNEVKSVNNRDLLNKFLEKRRELRQCGYSDKELLDSYGFLYVHSAQEVETLCREGIRVGNNGVSCIGHPEMGVQLCRFSDILQQEPLQYGQTGHIIIFKLMKGKIKSVTENRGVVYLEPTPNFDCHISKSTVTEGTLTSPGREYESTQIYLYEYSDLEVLPVPFPRHICPLFVVKFTYKGVPRDIKYSTKFNSSSVSRPGIFAQVNSRASSIVPQTSNTSSIHTSPSIFPYCASANLNSIPTSRLATSAPAPTAGKSDDNGNVVWSGSLLVMGNLPCHVDLLSSSSNLKPGLVGKSIDIKMRVKRDIAKSHYFSQVKALRRNADVFTNSQYYSVCNLKPRVDNSSRNFQLIVKYFSKTDSVGLIYLGENNYLVIIPIGKLTEELGLFSEFDPNSQLCCVFISQKPRRQILRSIRAAKESTMQYTTSTQCPAPMPELPRRQLFRHSVSWAPGDTASPFPDYDRGFQTGCPQDFLVKKAILHNLFVEQILIQRQHNCITGALHVPKKLYSQKTANGFDIKSKPDASSPNDNKMEHDTETTQKTRIFGEDETCHRLNVTGKVLKVSCSASLTPSDMSPTIISPDTTFQDHDLKANPLSAPKVSEPTLEGAVSSTVSEPSLHVFPNDITDELAEQIVRGFRQNCHRLVPNFNRVNPRDPRKHKLSEPSEKLATSLKSESGKKMCLTSESLTSANIEIDSKTEATMEFISSTSVLEASQKPQETNVASFSPENVEEKIENSANNNLHSATCRKDVSSKNVSQYRASSCEVKGEPEIASTATDMRELLDSGLDDPNLKGNDCSDDEADFEEPTWEEISNALDKQLFMSTKQSVKPKSSKDQTSCEKKTSSQRISGLSITVKNDTETISSGSLVKPYVNLKAQSGGSTYVESEGKDVKVGEKIENPPKSILKTPFSSDTSDIPKVVPEFTMTKSAKKGDPNSSRSSLCQKRMETVLHDAEDLEDAKSSCIESPSTIQSQRPPICLTFPGSSCSKTIPAGFFSDAECLISLPKNCSSVMFEEDVVISDLGGNQKTNDLLVFLTNVAQKYNHFVGNYFKQAGLDESLLNSDHISSRTVTVGFLYPDMTVMVANQSQGDSDLENCVTEVLHGKRDISQCTTLSDVSNHIKFAVHTRAFAKTVERHVQKTNSIIDETVCPAPHKKAKDNIPDSYAVPLPCVESPQNSSSMPENSPSCNSGQQSGSVEDVSMSKVSLGAASTDREGAESKPLSGDSGQLSKVSSSLTSSVSSISSRLMVEKKTNTTQSKPSPPEVGFKLFTDCNGSRGLCDKDSSVRTHEPSLFYMAEKDISLTGDGFSLCPEQKYTSINFVDKKFTQQNCGDSQYGIQLDESEVYDSLHHGGSDMKTMERKDKPGISSQNAVFQWKKVDNPEQLHQRLTKELGNRAETHLSLKKDKDMVTFRPKRRTDNYASPTATNMDKYGTCKKKEEEASVSEETISSTSSVGIHISDEKHTSGPQKNSLARRPRNNDQQQCGDYRISKSLPEALRCMEQWSELFKKEHVENKRDRLTGNPETKEPNLKFKKTFQAVEDETSFKVEERKAACNSLFSTKVSGSILPKKINFSKLPGSGQSTSHLINQSLDQKESVLQNWSRDKVSESQLTKAQAEDTTHSISSGASAETLLNKDKQTGQADGWHKDESIIALDRKQQSLHADPNKSIGFDLNSFHDKAPFKISPSHSTEIKSCSSQITSYYVNYKGTDFTNGTLLFPEEQIDIVDNNETVTFEDALGISITEHNLYNTDMHFEPFHEASEEDDDKPAHTDENNPANTCTDDDNPTNACADYKPAPTDDDDPANTDNDNPANTDDNPPNTDDDNPANTDGDNPANTDGDNPANTVDNPANNNGDNPANTEDNNQANTETRGSELYDPFDLDEPSSPEMNSTESTAAFDEFQTAWMGNSGIAIRSNNDQILLRKDIPGNPSSKKDLNKQISISSLTTDPNTTYYEKCGLMNTTCSESVTEYLFWHFGKDGVNSTLTQKDTSDDEVKSDMMESQQDLAEVNLSKGKASDECSGSFMKQEQKDEATQGMGTESVQPLEVNRELVEEQRPLCQPMNWRNSVTMAKGLKMKTSCKRVTCSDLGKRSTSVADKTPSTVHHVQVAPENEFNLYSALSPNYQHPDPEEGHWFGDYFSSAQNVSLPEELSDSKKSIEQDVEGKDSIKVIDPLKQKTFSSLVTHHNVDIPTSAESVSLYDTSRAIPLSIKTVCDWQNALENNQKIHLCLPSEGKFPISRKLRSDQLSNYASSDQKESLTTQLAEAERPICSTQPMKLLHSVKNRMSPLTKKSPNELAIFSHSGRESETPADTKIIDIFSMEDFVDTCKNERNTDFLSSDFKSTVVEKSSTSEQFQKCTNRDKEIVHVSSDAREPIILKFNDAKCRRNLGSFRSAFSDDEGSDSIFSHSDENAASSDVLLSPGGGILIPEDSVFLESSSEDIQRLLKHLEKLKDAGCSWSVKVHSQQICKLATKRRIFKMNSSANVQATAVLKMLTRSIKCGVVELLKQHSCDSTPFPSAAASSFCADGLHKQYCTADQQALLVTKLDGEGNTQCRGQKRLKSVSLSKLLNVCTD